MSSETLTRPRSDGVTAGFETIADAIMYRWRVERDTWVRSTEVARAREYLARAGIATSVTPDGRFRVDGATESPLGAAGLVLVGLRHVIETRRRRSEN